MTTSSQGSVDLVADCRDDFRGILSQALQLPPPVIAYEVGRRLAEMLPHRHVMMTDDCAFRPESFAYDGHCVLMAAPVCHAQIAHSWAAPDCLYHSVENAFIQVAWNDDSLGLLRLEWTEGYHSRTYHWIIADTQTTAEAFFQAVCAWCSEVRADVEVLVFDGGSWYKSEDLRHAIRDATFGNLVLRPGLKEEMCADFTRFFASRDLYEQYGVPWKRGVILTGPPGNGKTHAVKALVNKIGHACLYVKSFSSQYGSEHSNIHQVFRRARSTTPCVLVLEDLDSLVTDTNRSFFLNELDGFAANTGVVVVATTNHPERLDPAIVNRPSRFDRKYHFGLPGPDERRAYLALWRDSLRPELQPTDAGIADATDDTSGFSFAYLKELTVSSIMRWIDAPEPRAMDAVLGAQIAMLREQMSSMDALYDAPSSVPTGEDEEDA